MGRPRTQPLPTGIHERVLPSGTRVYAISFVDQHGQRHRENVGPSADAAIARRKQRLREVADGTFSTTPRTVRAYSETWQKGRAHIRTSDRETQILRDYVLPEFGEMALDAIRRTHVEAWLVRLLDGAKGKLAPKTVANILGVLSSMLAHAVRAGVLHENVARVQDLDEHAKPPSVEARVVGPWSREEMATLISHPAIPEPRRIAYAIAAYTGARLGELAGLRWRDLDTKAQPFWMWTLRSQRDGAPLKGKGRAGGPERSVPVHPALRAILEAWRRDGWARWVRRHPTDHDLVVCDADGSMLTRGQMGGKTVKRDAAKAGLTPKGINGSREIERDFHSFRRGFISTVLSDGALPHHIQRITHGKPKRAGASAFDKYNDPDFRDLCAAVGKLNLTPHAYAEAVSLPMTGTDGPGAESHARSHGDTGRVLTLVSRRGSLEVPGVEGGADRGSVGISDATSGSPSPAVRSDPPAIQSDPVRVSPGVPREPSDPVAAAADALRALSPDQLAAVLAALVRR